MEVDWNKGSWSRCIVEPTRLRRVFSVRVGVRAQKDALSPGTVVILSGKRAASVARREDGDGRVLPSHTSSSGGVDRTRWRASWNNSI